jgi:hypothetical protein
VFGQWEPGCNKSLSNHNGECFGAQVEISSVVNSSAPSTVTYISQISFHKMSETEAQKDLATEQPTAEDLKGVKRAAEVSPLSLDSSIFDLFSDSQNAGSHKCPGHRKHF